MFRITEDPSSGSLVPCLAKNYKNGSIVSVDMDSSVLWQHIVTGCACVQFTVYEGTSYTANTNLVHVNGHDRTILVIFSQALYNAP